MHSSPTRGLRDYTSIWFEILIAALTLVPFFMLVFFYSDLPERVPAFLKLNGEVAIWVKKSVLSVFRVPLMAVVTQIVCLLMKYGSAQSRALEGSTAHEKLQEQSLLLNARLWDWFRWTIAFKMSAESLDTVFLSVSRFRFLALPVFIISAIAAIVGVAGALFYVYRLLSLSRKLKKFLSSHTGGVIDKTCVHAGFLYFNRSDSHLFVKKYGLNFANKWAWLFIGCFVSYPLLVFLPG